ncbi:NAD-dependent epimerase/dehydratase family protein [Streptacidiphilus monticola]|uniref:NAD-dependent epimerase/dehydratase family protein n=1 Tax=Streptacidiphilus monticola TaxID=2161674 RepID=A0ABW1GBG6_9ACTN
MKLLLLGGSVFLGRAFGAEALRRGWEVTVFNRGRTQEDLPGVRAIRGDRTDPDDLARLAAQGPWDAVVDTSGYVPREVAASVAALSGAAGAYLYISSINARPHWPAEPVDESSPRHAGARPDAGPDDGGGDYGWLKTGCELAVEQGFAGRALILEPGLIIGPHDRARRTTWYLKRAAEGGRMVAPGAPERIMQVIDARDIAAFGLDRIEAEDSGTYLVSGTPANTTWGEFLGSCVEATGGKAELVWVDDEVLVRHEVAPWTELPLWFPIDDPEARAVWQPSSAKAIAAGLRCRPVPQSVRETAEWLFAPGGFEVAFGDYRSNRRLPQLSPEKEQAVLADWDARSARTPRT